MFEFNPSDPKYNRDKEASIERSRVEEDKLTRVKNLFPEVRFGLGDSAVVDLLAKRVKEIEEMPQRSASDNEDLSALRYVESRESFSRRGHFKV